MTENRYLTVLLTGDIKDTVTNEFLRGSGIARRLNELHEENEQSKMMIATLRNTVLDQEDLEKENKELQKFKDKVFKLIDKTIESETQIAENIESTIEGDYVKAVNRLTIIAFENLKKELSE